MKEILDWRSCIEQHLAKPVAPDGERVASLIEIARSREKTAEMLPLNDTTKETLACLFYDVLRELLEAIAIQKGYKIYNHECYTYFLRTIINKEDFAFEFDSLRKLRNAINYYGRKILLQDAERAIQDTRKWIIEARKMIK